MDEYAVAGGLHGSPVPLVKCKTVDLEVPADAELVLEGELLPIGWTADEGPFGEFSQITGDVKWNPIFRVRCITHRRSLIFYLLQMPWENDWLAAPVTEAAGLRALRNASIKPVAIRAPAGSRYVAEGYGVVVDLDLEKFFNRVNHDGLMRCPLHRERLDPAVGWRTWRV